MMQNLLGRTMDNLQTIGNWIAYYLFGICVIICALAALVPIVVLMLPALLGKEMWERQA